MAKKTKKTDQPLTTAQQIGSLIKTARGILRKDKGLSTDIDRLPLLTWVMFLKFLDDMEREEESKSVMRGAQYRPAIEAPYRWRDWAAMEDGITGSELLAFINQDETTLPDGSKGSGLLKYLRDLPGGSGSLRRQHVISTVFKDISCRMLSGFILREVINKINGIHFLAKEEVFTLGHLYETMLQEMRDAAGENGEFYTPRPVVRLMVDVVNPRLGESVLDPACGTGGFLVEAFVHLQKQCQTAQRGFCALYLNSHQHPLF
jgi:type I restriction enzyme M protein